MWYTLLVTLVIGAIGAAVYLGYKVEKMEEEILGLRMLKKSTELAHEALAAALRRNDDLAAFHQRVMAADSNLDELVRLYNEALRIGAGPDPASLGTAA